MEMQKEKLENFVEDPSYFICRIKHCNSPSEVIEIMKTEFRIGKPNLVLPIVIYILKYENSVYNQIFEIMKKDETFLENGASVSKSLEDEKNFIMIAILNTENALKLLKKW